MKNNKLAFTLVEILVAVGILTVIMTIVGGIMGMSFKAKNTSDGNELLSSKAVFVLGELKRNVLNAKYINPSDCPLGIGRSLAFETRDGKKTTLRCRYSQIASESANGNFYFLDLGTTALNCSNFVECNISNGKVTSVNFNLNLRAPDGVAGAGSTGFFYGVATPRE